MIAEALGRWLLALTAFAFFGLYGLRWLDARRPGREPAPACEVPFGRLGLACGIALLVTLGLRAGLQALQAFGWPDGFSLEAWRSVALESRWGGRWRWQLIAAGVGTVGFLALAARQRRVGWLVACVGGLGLVAALPMTGHAYGQLIPWVAQSLHWLGGGLWLGTLFLVAFLPAAWLPQPAPSDLRLGWLRAFSPLAVTGAALLGASGLVLAIGALPTWEALWREPYGQLLLTKIVLAVAVVALGGRNYRRFHGAGGWAGTSVPRTVAVEGALALLVLLVTGWLAASPRP